MCYSLQSSIIAYIFAIVTFFFMNKRGTKYDNYVKYLILAYSIVQIGDAIIWHSGVLPNKQNILGTNIVYFGLLIQSFAIGYAVYKNDKNQYLLILGTLVSLYYLLKMNSKPSKIMNGNLVWGFNGAFYLTIYIVIFFILFNSELNKKYTLILFVWFSLFGYYYLYYKKYKGGGSIWCYMAALSTPLLYFVPKIF